ncbi:MAG: YceI family protein, partial [Metallibacterium scheffleri]
QGTLTLRGVSKPVPLLLRFSVNGADALLTLDASVPRLAFAVGGGQWASASAIGLDVAVHGVLKLAPAR